MLKDDIGKIFLSDIYRQQFRCIYHYRHDMLADDKPWQSTSIWKAINACRNHVHQGPSRFWADYTDNTGFRLCLPLKYEPSHVKKKTKIWGSNQVWQSQKQAKTKVLISCAVTAQLICPFVFAYADCWFSDAVVQTMIGWGKCNHLCPSASSVNWFSKYFITDHLNFDWNEPRWRAALCSWALSIILVI